MERNMGSVDRIIRLVVGLLIIGLGVYFSNWLGAIGLILVGTAAIGWCPLYKPFGISTCAVKE